MRTPSIAFFLAACALMAAPSATSASTEGSLLTQELVKLDRDKVKYGEASQFDSKRGDKVGTVRSTEVYEAIPAYKTIRKEGVTEGSARWQQLMQEATTAFKAGLRTVASNQGLVLIVEEGGISGYSTSDVTASVTSAVSGLL